MGLWLRRRLKVCPQRGRKNPAHASQVSSSAPKNPENPVGFRFSGDFHRSGFVIPQRENRGTERPLYRMGAQQAEFAGRSD
jgi:hypothetical protein